MIVYEILYVFDINGVLFDEYGSLNNWWIDEDFEVFKKFIDKVVE